MFVLSKSFKSIIFGRKFGSSSVSYASGELSLDNDMQLGAWSRHCVLLDARGSLMPCGGGGDGGATNNKIFCRPRRMKQKRKLLTHRELVAGAPHTWALPSC